ncbi:transcriptional repressor [Devosia pacifica]|uniref:Transcriptional repressor n=1 Tax=Devosia pacifica TaxID=1335967 RepID=A0A918SA50_9HYPH|nr:Fur family transcriptional regulator [Devosia pacifica]GHA30985.1 transcriptional repressor [Devosia pacifica]
MAHTHDGAHDLTRNQSLVLETLNAQPSPLSAYDILDRLRGAGLRAPLQVYRALDKLVAMGLAHRLESLNAFVACADAQCHRKGLIGFAICENCGRVDEFADEVIETQLGTWADRTGFSIKQTTMEIRGRCALCREAA